MPSVSQSAEHVGAKFTLRNGHEITVSKFEPGFLYPVVAQYDGQSERWMATGGWVGDDVEHKQDIASAVNR